MKSKQSIRILIGLMSLALVGVIVIQFLWIRGAMLLKQEQFDRSVSAAMVRVSADLENKYGVHFITEKLETDSSARKAMLKQDPGFYKFMISVDESKVEQMDEAPEEASDTVQGDGFVAITSSYNVCNNGDGTMNMNKDMEVRTGAGKSRVVAMVNVNNIGKQQIYVEKSAMAGPPEPSAPPAAPNCGDPNKLMRIVTNVADEYAMSKMTSKDISDVIDSPKISSAIQKEFTKQGLPLDFEFATYCVQGDTLMINRGSSHNPLQDYAYKSPLLATDFIESGSLLLINFPSKFKYLFASVAGMLVLSLLFTLSIVTAFAYSLHVIFKQKKLSDITNDFINNMTHELKTPLATISMTADTLGLASVNNNAEKVSEYSGMIKKEVKKLSRQVDRILESAVLERQESEVNVEAIDINQLMQEEVKLFEPQIYQRNGNITSSFPAEQIYIGANREHLRGVICNLLDNALKYSTEEPDIKISLSKGTGTLLLSIADKGIGISKADQVLIFDKFYRAHTGNRHDVKGFGLGLSFVKSVVEQLHGRVWVESELGKGSKFFVEIPNH